MTRCSADNPLLSHRHLRTNIPSVWIYLFGTIIKLTVFLVTGSHFLVQRGFLVLFALCFFLCSSHLFLVPCPSICALFLFLLILLFHPGTDCMAYCHSNRQPWQVEIAGSAAMHDSPWDCRMPTLWNGNEQNTLPYKKSPNADGLHSSQRRSSKDRFKTTRLIPSLTHTAKPQCHCFIIWLERLDSRVQEILARCLFAFPFLSMATLEKCKLSQPLSCLRGWVQLKRSYKSWHAFQS